MSAHERKKTNITPTTTEAEAFLAGGRKEPANANKPPKSVAKTKAPAAEGTAWEKAAQAVARGTGGEGLVSISVRVKPETVRRLDLLAQLRKQHRRTDAPKQVIIEQALAAFLPSALEELLEDE